MPEIEELIERIRQEHFVAVPEMLRSAQSQQCNSPETLKATEDFIHILRGYYKEIKTVLEAIQTAAKVLKTKLDDYNQQHESLGDL